MARPSSSSTPMVPPVGSGTYEDTNSALSFSGSWTNFVDGANSGGSAKFTNQSGSQVSLTFDGQVLTLIYLKQSNAGIATVTIDGSAVEQLDTYGPTRRFGDL